jgi:hypothetical protein
LTSLRVGKVVGGDRSQGASRFIRIHFERWAQGQRYDVLRESSDGTATHHIREFEIGRVLCEAVQIICIAIELEVQAIRSPGGYPNATCETSDFSLENGL